MVVEKQVGRGDGAAAELAHEVAGGGIFGDDVKVVEEFGPGDEAGFVGDDIEVGEEQLDGGGGEEVAAGDFEVGSVGKGNAEFVGIEVGGDDDGDTSVGVEGGVAFGKGDGKGVFVGDGALAEGAGGAVEGAAKVFFVEEVVEVVVAGAEETAVAGLGLSEVEGSSWGSMLSWVEA